MFTLCMSRGANKQLQDNVTNANHMGKQIKGGYLLRYRRGWLCRTWCEEWVALYEDSTVAWFKDKGTAVPRGRLQLSESPELVAVGEWTRQVPRRPRTPADCHVGQLMAFGSRAQGRVHWLMAQSASEVSDWITAISNTLPPPPRLPLDRDKRCSVTLIRDHNRFANGCSNCSSVSRTLSTDSNRRSYDNEHTVAPGVVTDWGHGWGWGEVAWAAQLVSAQDTAVATTLYCPTIDDYSVGGYDVVVDYSACGDFMF